MNLSANPCLYQLLCCLCFRCVFVVPHVHKPHRLHSQHFSVRVYSFKFPSITRLAHKGWANVSQVTLLRALTVKEILKEEKPITSVITPHLRVIYI